MLKRFLTKSLRKIPTCVPRTRISAAAREDLRDIRAHSKSAFGAQTAFAYMEGMRAIFALLRDRPMIGPAESDLHIGLRGFRYRSHRIYYLREGDDVVIVRILHHARDARRSDLWPTGPS